MNRISARSWADYETYQLWLAYQLETPYRVLTRYFKRSPTAINKYLCRSGIRAACEKSRSQVRDKPIVHSVDQLHDIIIQCKLDLETVAVSRCYTRKWKPSKQAFEALLSYGLAPPAPWAQIKRVKILPKKSEVGRMPRRTPWEYTSLQGIINYLIRHGYSIDKIRHSNQLKLRYKLNEKSVRPYRLLMEANILRRENKEPIFYVKGITCE